MSSVKSVERNQIAAGRGIVLGSQRQAFNPLSRLGTQRLGRDVSSTPLRRRSVQLLTSPESDDEIIDDEQTQSEGSEGFLEKGMQEFLDTLEKYAQFVEPRPHSISGGALSTEDVAGDISFGIRVAGPLMGPSSAAYDSLGHTTSENFFLGFYNAYKAFRRFMRARRIADNPGMIEEGVSMVRGGAQGLGGATFFAYRNMSIAAQVTQAEVSMTSGSALGVGTFAVGVVGSIFFIAVFALLGAWSGLHLYRSLKMRAELLRDNGDAAKVSFLFAQIHSSTPDKIRKIRQEDAGKKERFKARLREICINEFVFQFFAWQNGAIARGEALDSVYTEAEVRQRFENFFKRIEEDPRVKKAYEERYLQQMDLKKEDMEGLDLTPMELCGLKLFEQQRQQRKEARLTRWLGDRAVEQIKTAYQYGLDIRVSEHSTDVVKAEVAELLTTVRQEVDRQILIQGIGTLIGGLGVVTLVAGLGFVALPAIVNVGLIVATFLMIALMLGIDFHFMREGLESGRPGPHDRKFVMLITGIMLLSLVLAIGLTVGLSLPIFPLVMTLLGGGLILGVCAYSYYKLGLLEKKWEEEHPEISRLIEAPSHEERLKLYKKLSKQDRAALRAHDEAFYETHQSSFKPVVLGYLNDIRDGKEGVSSDFLAKALKRMSKQLWAKFQYSRNQNDRAAAKEFQEICDAILSKDYTALSRFTPSQNIMLEKNLFVLIKRHEFENGFKYTLEAGRQRRQEALEESTYIRSFLASETERSLEEGWSEVGSVGSRSSIDDLAGMEIRRYQNYDFGFDPRASKDGRRYLQPSPLISTPALRRSFLLETWEFLQHGKLRQKLIDLKQRESELAQMSYLGFVISNSEQLSEVESTEMIRLMQRLGLNIDDAINNAVKDVFILAVASSVISVYDYQFIRQIEEVYTLLFPEEPVSKTWLHYELLWAIYKIRQPQDADRYTPGNNADLGRHLAWAKELSHLDSNNRQKEFIENTESTSLALIDAMRSLRDTIQNQPLERMSPENLQLLKDNLKQFKLCWDKYIASDSLLKRANVLFSTGNYRVQEEQYQETKRQRGFATFKFSCFQFLNDDVSEYEREQEATHLNTTEQKMRTSFCERIQSQLYTQMN